jgi:hypothetical protein
VSCPLVQLWIVERRDWAFRPTDGYGMFAGPYRTIEDPMRCPLGIELSLAIRFWVVRHATALVAMIVRIRPLKDNVVLPGSQWVIWAGGEAVPRRMRAGADREVLGGAVLATECGPVVAGFGSRREPKNSGRA